MNRVLRMLASRSFARARRNPLRLDPLWLAIGAAAWIAQRAVHQPGGAPVWQGSVPVGETLRISVRDSASRTRGGRSQE